jgi:hypothetical protein
MRKGIINYLICATFISAMTANVYAVGPGFYMGIGAGPATTTGGNQIINVANPPGPPGAKTLAKPKSTQFGSGVFLGYKINQYAGFEGGFSFFSKVKYTSKLPAQSGTSARVRTAGMNVKGYFPIGNGPFSLFGKVGAAATYLTYSGALSSSGKNQYKSKVSPTFAIGAGYDLNQSWLLELSANRVLVGSVVGNVDWFELGISYHFVDRYCGQFLCDD